MNSKSICEGIEHCLANSIRLIEDAEILREKSRYQSVIPLYVFAYEEIGKSIYLYSKLLDGATLTQVEFDNVAVGRGAHLRKILSDYEHVTRTLENMTNKEFEEIKKWAKENNKTTWTTDRKTAIENNKLGTKMIEQLHDLKMGFLYVSYKSGRWITLKVYSPGMLAAVTTFLYLDVIAAYYRIRLNMYLYSIGVRRKKQPLTKEQEQLMLSHEYCLKLNATFEIFSRKDYRETRRVAKAVIESIIDEISKI